MRSISGVVQVRETGAGIPNLVVAAYDAEKAVPCADDEPQTSTLLHHLGRRIGSVVTDGDGRFILTSEQLEFQGNESRPDLSLVVFAPEDVQSIDAPFPLPPERRVLYVSLVPRLDAGAEEAFVIRLLQAQLDRVHLSAASSVRPSRLEAESFANAIESGWAFHDRLREHGKPRVKQQQEKHATFRAMALETVKKLSGIPLHLRDERVRNNQFLIADRRDLPAALPEMQQAAVAEGLRRMKDRAPTLRLTLTPADLTDLGLRVKDGELVGSIDPTMLATKVRSLTKGVDLIRVRGLDNPPPDELERRYLSGAAATAPAISDSSPPAPPLPTRATNEG
jgi:hypothetical protein